MRNIRHILPLLLLSASFAFAAPPQKTQSFWSRVLKLLGVTATPANQKGDEDPTTEGDIWLYKVDLRVASPLKQGSFRSPVFLPSGKTVLALSGDKVIKIDIVLDGTQVVAGPSTELFTKPGILKLVAVESDAPDQVLVLTDLDHDNCPGVGVLNLTDGNIAALPHNDSKDDRDLVAYLRRSERAYDDGTKLEVRLGTKTRNGTNLEATEVFFKPKDKDWVNVSRCPAGVNCGQPALSSDRKFVLFIGKV
jgi:hypothetical protein